MAEPRRGDGGFSLIEMMVVVFLMTIIVSAIGVMQSAMLRDKGKILRDATMHDQADFARRRMISVLSDATQILTPTLGTFGNEVIGWQDLDTLTFVNCEPSPGTCTPNPNSPVNIGWRSVADGSPNFGWGVTWFRLCYQPDSAKMGLYLYRAPMNTAATYAPYPPAPGVSATFQVGLLTPPNNSTCGDLSPSGITFTENTGTQRYEVLAGVAGAQIATLPDWAAVFRRVRKNTIDFGYSMKMFDAVFPADTGKMLHTEVQTRVTTLGSAL